MTGVIKKRLFILFVLCITIFVSLTGYICNDLFFKSSSEYINVFESNNINYTVFLKDNPFIQKPFLGMNENYLSTYTDYIKIDSDYICRMSKDVNLQYSYSAVVNLISRYKKNPGVLNNPQILQKEYVVDSEIRDIKSNEINISRSYDLHLGEYQRELDDFADTVDLPVSNEIRVDFKVLLKNPDGVSSEFIRSLVIPVSTEFYTIDISFEKERTDEYNVPVKTLSVFTAVILSVISAMFFAAALVLLKKIIDKNSTQRDRIYGYLRLYRDVIVKTDSPFDFSSHKVITVKDFKELLNMSRIVHLPVLYFDGDATAVFYLVSGGIVHLFEVEI